MKKYQSHKEVMAAKIDAIFTSGTNIEVVVEGEENPVQCDPMMFARFHPKPGDYLVFYEDGYRSFSPKKAFEEGYTLIPTEGE